MPTENVRRRPRRFVFGMAAMMAVIIPAGLAWACVGVVVFKTTSSATVQPGGTVEVFGGEFARGKPVAIHLDSPTGPVLTTFESPQPSTMTSQFKTMVPIPGDITSGEHFLVATQDHYDMNSGIPARTAIYVNAQPPGPAQAAARPTAVVADSGPSGASLVLVGLGVAAAALVVAATWTLMASRKPSAPGTGATA